ncbi:MAG TPA: ABC transporter ATP-binding protein [Candidatus Limnocylindria bacterium]|nr:ABC transporter ATP-binding protein [Candidatus Limnocylindria bacterium]
MTAPAVEARGLTKHYRKGAAVVRALDGVDLVIGRGELVAVVGRSGSGKTTFLDTLGLLLRPTSGRVLLDGEDTGGLSDGARATLRGRKIGFVFQEFNLLPGLTALENVLLPLRYTKVDGGRERAHELLATVGLDARAGHRPTELSGGEQQRVAIARSLVNGPSLVLADEPTGELDTDTSAEIVALMRRMNRERGVTFVIVTHDADVASRADRVVRLKDGRVLSDERAAAAV